MASAQNILLKLDFPREDAACTACKMTCKKEQKDAKVQSNTVKYHSIANSFFERFKSNVSLRAHAKLFLMPKQKQNLESY